MFKAKVFTNETDEIYSELETDLESSVDVFLEKDTEIYNSYDEGEEKNNYKRMTIAEAYALALQYQHNVLLAVQNNILENK